MAYFIATLSECGIVEFVFNCALSATKEKERFVSRDLLYDVIIKLRWNQLDDIDRILTFGFPNVEAITEFKRKFVETNADLICCKLILKFDWKEANAFIHWCFPSKEEMSGFFNNFVHGMAFVSPFLPYNWGRPFIDALLSLIRVNSLESPPCSDELILQGCLNALSKCHDWFYAIHLEKIELLYFRMDRLLLSFFQNDMEIVNGFKKKLFADKKRKLYILIPLEFLRKRNKQLSVTVWDALTTHFFNWICSSDENLKAELKHELNHAKEFDAVLKQICDRHLK